MFVSFFELLQDISMLNLSESVHQNPHQIKPLAGQPSDAAPPLLGGGTSVCFILKKKTVTVPMPVGHRFLWVRLEGLGNRGLKAGVVPDLVEVGPCPTLETVKIRGKGWKIRGSDASEIERLLSYFLTSLD